MKFADLHPNLSLLKALAARGYEHPTAVQALVLKPEHCARDLLVSAQTGSGKTIAFGLAFAAELLGDREVFERAAAPLALVVAPTRELALQVQTELAWLYAITGAKIRACVGGMDVRRELRSLSEGAHVVVGTPGRLCDHLERGSLDLSRLRAVVLDEADEMLDMGFRDELERILRDAPASRRTLLFSATIPQGIGQLAGRYQTNALRLVATPPEQAHQDIEYRCHLIALREREHAVVNTLRYLEPTRAIVFCSTRDAVKHLEVNLVERGFMAVAISGELTQVERTRALTALRDGRARVLVATDVAARGLDLPALELVVHADLPRDAQVLQHRSGRTGRAGRKGVSVLLVPFRARLLAEKMLKTAKIKPKWSDVSSFEEIRALDQDRLTAELGSLGDEANEEDLAVAKRLLSQRSPEQLLSALVRQYRAKLPAPEEIVESVGLGAPKAEKKNKKKIRERERSEPDLGRRSEPSPSGRKRARSQPESGVWFRLNVGSLANADPRWLVPLICRRGGVVKDDIGKIQILLKETRFLISIDAATRFARAARKPDRKDPAISIERVSSES